MSVSARGRRIGRNIVSMTVALVFSRAFSFVTTIHLARVLLADNFGVIVFATTLLSYAELFVIAGFNSLGPREVARDPTRVPSLVRAILTIRLLLALFAIGLLAAFVYLWPNIHVTQSVALIYGLSLFVTALDLTWLFAGIEAMHFIALCEVVTQTLMAVGVLVLVQNPNQILRVPFIYVFAEACGAAVLAVIYMRRFGRLHLGFEFPLWKKLGGAALPLALSSAMGMITFNFDTLVVGLGLGTYSAGIYGAAYRIIWIPSLISAAYFTALYPPLSRANNEGLESVANLLNKSIRITGAVALGMGVAGTLLAAQGFNFLFPNQEFSASVLPFQILIWSISLMFLNRNYRTLLVAFNQQKAELKVITTAAIVNVVLNLVFIPLLGLPGAALATVASETIILVFGYLYTRKLVGHVPLGRYLPRLILAAAVLGIALYVTDPWNLFLRIVLGGAVYAAALLSFRVITPFEIRLVLDSWQFKRTAPVTNEGQAAP